MIHHGDTAARSKLLHEELTEKIIGAALEVHRVLGPGLLESAYEECFCREFNFRKLEFRRQVPLPAEHKGLKLDCGYRLDLIVQDAVILDMKCREHILTGLRSAVAHLSQAHRQTCGHNHQLQGGNVARSGIVRKVL